MINENHTAATGTVCHSEVFTFPAVKKRAVQASGFEETVPITILPENGFVPVSAIHPVVNRAFKFHPELARHGGTPSPTTRLCP